VIELVKGKIVDKIKVADLKSSDLSPVIPQTPVGTEKTLVSAEPIIEEGNPVEPPVIPEHKAKAKKTAKSKAEVQTSVKAVTWPIEAKINKYGFLHFSQGMMETIGLEKGVDHQVKLKFADGILSVEFSLGGNV
jgi:hypothetical protein